MMESHLRRKIEMWKSFAFLTLPFSDICVTDILFWSVALSSHCLLIVLFEKKSNFDKVQLIIFFSFLG